MLGALTVIPLYFFTDKLLRSRPAAIIASLILAFAPWHIVLSRSTSDGALGLFFMVTGLSLLVTYVQNKKSFLFILSVLSLLTSYLFYHSFRLLVPFLVIPFYFYPKIEKKEKKKILLAAGITLLASIILFITPAGSGRFNQVLITGNGDIQSKIVGFIAGEGPGHVLEAKIFHNKPVTYIREFLKQYGDYFSPSFLFSRGGLPDRYVVPDVGLFYWILAPFFLLGIVKFFQKKSFENYYLLLFLLLAPLPAAVTLEDVPNLHRAVIEVIPITIIAAAGIASLLTIFKKKKLIIVTSVIGLLFIAEFAYFWHQYSVFQKQYKPYYHNDAFRELSQTINDLRKNYDVVYVPAYESIPIYYLFYANEFNMSPDKFLLQGSLKQADNIQFVNFWCPAGKVENLPKNSKILYVNKGDCPADPRFTVVDKLFQSDGGGAFTFLK